MSASSEIFITDIELFNSKIPLWFFFYNLFYFIEVLYQLINCHHVFLYILNIVCCL